MVRLRKFLPIGLLIIMTVHLSGWILSSVNAAPKEDFPSFYVNHQTNNKEVLVECIVNGISFRKEERSEQKTGKIVIWIDGQRKSEAAQAAFIIKGLTPGSHKIRLDVVNLHNDPYGLSKEFMVNIPK